MQEEYPVVALGPVRIDALLRGNGVQLTYSMADLEDPWCQGRRSHVIRTAAGETRGQAWRGFTVEAASSADPVVRYLGALGAVDDAVWYGGAL